MNFITGAGGLLQAVLFGYGGIRFRENKIDINPTRFPHTTSWAIRGVKYRGVTFDVEVKDTTMKVHFKTIPTNKRIEAKKNDQLVPLHNGRIQFEKSLVSIMVTDVDASSGATVPFHCQSILPLSFLLLYMFYWFRDASTF